MLTILFNQHGIAAPAPVIDVSNHPIVRASEFTYPDVRRGAPILALEVEIALFNCDSLPASNTAVNRALIQSTLRLVYQRRSEFYPYAPQIIEPWVEASVIRLNADAIRVTGASMGIGYRFDQPGLLSNVGSGTAPV